jgi:hypothetical protein
VELTVNSGFLMSCFVYVYIKLKTRRLSKSVNNGSTGVNTVAGLEITFADINRFCVETGSKHESRGYKYFKEKYIHDVRGTETVEIHCLVRSRSLNTTLDHTGRRIFIYLWLGFGVVRCSISSYTC